jgi:hypothetical protein
MFLPRICRKINASSKNLIIRSIKSQIPDEYFDIKKETNKKLIDLTESESLLDNIENISSARTVIYLVYLKNSSI